jgi:phage I-like protein
VSAGFISREALKFTPMKYALSHLCVAVALASGATFAPGAGYTEPVIIPDGEFDSHDGRPGSIDGVTAKKWRLTAASAERVIAAIKRMGRDIQIDFDHASEDPELKAAGKAIASGWLRFDSLTYEPGRGIVGRIEWTDDAAAAIAKKQYRFLSPVIFFNKKTGDVLGLKSIALTNDPALNLPATAQLTAETAASLGLDIDSDSDYQTKGDDVSTLNKAAICAAMGLAVDADENSVITACVALKASNAKPAEPDGSKYVSIASLTAEQSAHANTKKALAELTAKVNGESFAAELKAAKAEGALINDEFETHLTKLCAEQGADMARATLKAVPRVPAFAGKLQSESLGAKTGAGEGVAALSASEKEVCAQLGISAESFAKQKAELAKEQATA